MVLLGVAGCGQRAPVNPPRLVLADETSMSIQLFMQATILMGRYFGFNRLDYERVREQSEKAGFTSLPFMPPETIPATPPLRTSTLRPWIPRAGDDRADVSLVSYQKLVHDRIGYNNLVKYYISTGLRAAQMICRNHLQGLEERNRYLDFLQAQFGVFGTLSEGVLNAVDANGTLRSAMFVGRTFVTSSMNEYEKYRYLTVPYEEARVVVETAQNLLADHYYRKVDGQLPNLSQSRRTIYRSPFTFADALHAVSVIESQCTRAGIQRLMTKAFYATPTNMVVDPGTGAIIFNSNTQAGNDQKAAPLQTSGNPGRPGEKPPAAEIGRLVPEEPAAPSAEVPRTP